MKRRNDFIINLFQFKSIQSSIWAAFSILILLTTLIMSFISYHLSTDAVRRNSQEYTSELIKQVNTNIQFYINQMENISTMALNNNDVKHYLSLPNSSSKQEKRNYEEKISDLFHSILVSRKDIASIMVFGNDGRFVSDRKDAILKPYTDLSEQLWYKKAKEMEGRVVISPSNVQHIFRDEYRWVVSLSREMRNAAEEESAGVFLVDLNFSAINDMCSKIRLGKRGYVYIVDDDGNIVYHPQQQLIYSNLKTEMIDQVIGAHQSSFITDEGEQSRIYTVHDTGFGWKIVGVAYLNELVSNKSEMKLSFTLWGIFGLVIALLCSIAISLKLSRPIKLLQTNMKQVEKGNFDIRVDIQNTNEIGQLSRSFNMMVSKIKELMSQIVQEQEFKRKSELKALQAQIHPHFLYNTLDSIIWMAESKKYEEVVLMTSSLAKLFRSSIGNGDELISIRIEIDHITNYLTIQKMRYKDKLDFQVDVDRDILHYKTLKVLLQPLVENAIYHGIKNKSGVGIVKITGRKVDEQIYLQVKDNGVGMIPEKVKTMLIPKNNFPNGKGVGVVNVDERIKLYFGESYGLSFESEPDEGTTVTIRIPARE